MSRLDNLYKAMETFCKEGLPIDENIEKKANEIEEEIMKKEILPILTKNIEPALQPVQRELVLVVDYARTAHQCAFKSQTQLYCRYA